MSISDQDLKTLQEAFAKQGTALVVVGQKNGTTTFYATRWGLTKELPNLEAVHKFLFQIGGVNE